MPDSGYDEMKSAVMNVVTTAFRPEFINRVDDAVVFHSLGKEQIKRIAHIQLEILQRRVNEARIDLQFDEDSLAFLVEAGYDPVYGARPLKRAIQQYVENPLAEAILSGDYVGGDQIRASTADKSIVFAKS
jgi:ATP-dependent Clp protease ATP-binding subunit ClpB